ncbi:MAG: hypothetical protein NTV51_30455 [Verrucomicrobia bacterium]|nr:hypothetical protein [Verrucomicrobiota bacterium]
MLWGVVIVAQYLAWRLDEWWIQDTGVDRETLAKAVLGLWGLHLVIAWLLVPQIVQDDSLHDERAGWRTRPISAGRMLAAKVGGLAVMLWLWPSLCTLPWWIEFGYGPAEVVRTIVVNMIGMAAFTSVAMLVTVLVGSFARFLLWSVVAVVAIALGGLMLAAGMPASSDDGAVNGSILLTRAALGCGLVWAAAALVVPLNYLKRAPRLAQGIVAGAALLAVGVVQSWPWSAAQMRAALGGKSSALPTVTVRVSSSTLVVPSDPGRQRTKLLVPTEFSSSGQGRGVEAGLKTAEPRWRMGERRGVEKPVPLPRNLNLTQMATDVARGETARRDQSKTLPWEIAFPGQSATALRNGEAVVGARNEGAVWQAVAGPSVVVREGAWAGRGLAQLHVGWVGIMPTRDRYYDYEYERARRSLQWVQTDSLMRPAVLLELLNVDGMAGRRFTTALLKKGDKSNLDTNPIDRHYAPRRFLGHGRTPVGLIGVQRFTSTFEQGYGHETKYQPEELIGEGATLTSVVFQEAAPLAVTLADTPLVPDLVVEGRLEDALRSARAEEKRVFVRVKSGTVEDAVGGDGDAWYGTPRVRELLMTRFVCAAVTGAEAERLRKRTDEAGASLIVILKPNGEEQDRLRDLYWANLQAALEANLAGKTHAAVLMETLAARGGDDRRLRFQLHEALRARGELAGAFDAILWVAEHPSAPFEGSEVFNVGWRLERLVANNASARAALLERRELAVANLRNDPRDAGAARLLFTITLGLRRDEAIWREFPRVMPRENPLWWEFTRNWINASVTGREYVEPAKAVDLERFFAEGPAWVRAQLLQKRAMFPNGPPATVGDWQRQLVGVGVSCVEALAATKQAGAALRVAAAVRRIDGSAATRWRLVEVLRRAGAPELAERLRTEPIL